MSRAVKISKEWVDFLEEVADQLDTTIKAVMDSILEWFIEGGWEADEFPGVFEGSDLLEEEEEEEDLDDEYEIVEE